MNKAVIKTESFSRMAGLDIGSIEKNYKGLAIHALKGLHEYVGERINRLFSRPARILDIAAGAGAMTLRLQDMGHSVTACDYVAENFRLANSIEFFQIDLNTEFSKRIGKTFDGIVAVEIVEHLENPRHLLREIFSLLAPGGTLLLTTPNVDNPVSLALFVRLGWFQWFGDENYDNEGHITPISQWSLRKILKEAGYEQIEIDSFGDPFRVTSGWPKMRLLAMILRTLSKSSERTQGEILIITARKPA